MTGHDVNSVIQLRRGARQCCVTLLKFVCIEFLVTGKRTFKAQGIEQSEPQILTKLV